MSTRGAIARVIIRRNKTQKNKTQKNGTMGFKGVYHHWDSYPSGLGATLYDLRNGHFKKNTKEMLKYLINDCPQGWSTINNSDFSLPPATKTNHVMSICKECKEPNWKHYAQYYNKSNEEWVKAGEPICPNRIDGSYLVTDHVPVEEEKPKGPECFKEGEIFKITEKNASGCGCEYVYAFKGDTMYILSSYRKNGIKMIGMFGCGDTDATWKVIAEIDLNKPAPDWDKI